jgi:hypothetical protein
MSALPVATSHDLDPTFTPRTLVVGVTINGASKAYPFDALLRQSLILDDLGGIPIFIVVSEDKKSVRAFERTVDGRKLEFLVKPVGSDWKLVDAETASEWDFTGKAIAGQLSGRQLTKVSVLNDYWFDWKAYNPKTLVYDLGAR